VAKLISPFAEAAQRPVPKAPDGVPQVTLTPIASHPAFEVQAFDRSGKANAALGKALKLDAPELGQCSHSSGLRLIRTDVGRWIVHGEITQNALEEAAGKTCAVIDITHARAGLRLSGMSGVGPQVLHKLVKVDLSPDRFPIGRAAEMQLHHLGVMVIRVSKDAYDIYALASFAQDVFEAVADAAIEFGYTVDAEQGF
jgi:heterotetrameric sarcosine oxidase gamma subunit